MPRIAGLKYRDLTRIEQMQNISQSTEPRVVGIVRATGEAPIFSPGDAVRILVHTPIGHYRVPIYVRGKKGLIHAVIEPTAVNNEEEGYGRNAGARLHYYRVAIPMTEIWPSYLGSLNDDLRIEVFETWLERIDT
jgi:nitrile hydratase subunit beta